MRLGERLDDVLKDVRLAVRQLASAPAFTAISALTLALGIGVNSAIFALADETGGHYTHVKDFSDLKDRYEKLADELQATYRVTFSSRRSTHDGTARGIDVKVVRKGKLVSNVGTVDDQAAGLVVPQMDAAVYLLFLAGLGGMLAFPGLIRRLSRRTETA